MTQLIDLNEYPEAAAHIAALRAYEEKTAAVITASESDYAAALLALEDADRNLHQTRGAFQARVVEIYGPTGTGLASSRIERQITPHLLNTLARDVKLTLEQLRFETRAKEHKS
jgi:hypothetical protein